MKVFGTIIAAAAGVLLLSGTLAGETRSARQGLESAAQVASEPLPAWHPPVAGRSQERSRAHPALPEGHPPIPKELTCPVTGAVGKAGELPRAIRAPVEGLVRI